MPILSYISIAHLVDLAILKWVSVHLIKLWWAYNAVTRSHACF